MAHLKTSMRWFSIQHSIEGQPERFLKISNKIFLFNYRWLRNAWKSNRI